MDIVEVASHVMQLFAGDARVLKRIVKAQDSGLDVPDKAVQDMLAAGSCFAALDAQSQVCCSTQVSADADRR